VNLQLDLPSVRDNARLDILPWNVPTSAYLHGVDPSSPLVSASSQDLEDGRRRSCASAATRCSGRIRKFTSHLDEADVDAEVHEEPGMFHVYPILMPWSDAGRRTIEAAGTFVPQPAAVGDRAEAAPGAAGAA